MSFLKNKYILYSLFGILAFVGLILYNYFLAQQKLRDVKEAPLGVELVSFPESLRVDSTGTFIWKVDASPDRTTTFTTIYWGSESSPSALTKLDSPQAVGYPHSLPDYTNGTFALPLNFDQRIKFDKSGTFYFRGYAKVGSDHVWSPEEKIVINP